MNSTSRDAQACSTAGGTREASALLATTGRIEALEGKVRGEVKIVVRRASQQGPVNTGESEPHHDGQRHFGNRICSVYTYRCCTAGRLRLAWKNAPNYM